MHTPSAVALVSLLSLSTMTPRPPLEPPMPARRMAQPLSMNAPVNAPMAVEVALAADSPAAKEPPLARRAFAILDVGSPRIVVAPMANHSWFVAEPTTIDPIALSLERDGVPRAMPTMLGDLSGKPVTLIRRSGATCRARIGAFRAVRLLEERVDDDGAIDAELLEYAWNRRAAALTASITSADPACLEDVGAAVLGTKVTAVPVTEDLPAGLADAALARARASANWRAVQERYLRLGEDSDWHEYGISAAVLVGSADKGIVVVAMRSGACQGFQAALMTAYRVEGGKLGADIYIPHEGFREIRAAADVNDDGTPEMFFPGGVLVSSPGGGFVVEAEAETPDQVCSC